MWFLLNAKSQSSDVSGSAISIICPGLTIIPASILVEKVKLCGIIDCYLMGSESLEKIDVSARKLLEEVGYVEQDNS